MKITTLRDKSRIEAILRRNARLHLYEIGDLDDFFWPDTSWYTLDVPEPTSVALLYTAPALPVIVGLSEQPDDELRELFTLLVDRLPAHVYGHLSGNLVEILKRRYEAESHGVHVRMCLTDTSQLAHVDTSSVVHLTTADLPEVRAFYDESYPGNWFEPRMLETGCYFGIRAQGNSSPQPSPQRGEGEENPDFVRDASAGAMSKNAGKSLSLDRERAGVRVKDGGLISVAGVHVYSARYRVAALGNVTTQPDFRGRGLATATCARLCSALLETCDDIGLNVNVSNVAAIACYRTLGFTPVAVFEEFKLTEGET
jgi:RimJ/RimL family protein N-acetyltransferase